MLKFCLVYLRVHKDADNLMAYNQAIQYVKHVSHVEKPIVRKSICDTESNICDLQIMETDDAWGQLIGFLG